MKNISLFSTFIDNHAKELVNKTLTSTFLSEGKIVNKFEQSLSRIAGLLHPVTVNSGTSALHLALVLSGITKGDEVIIPAQTFIATGLAVLFQQAIPVFADIQYETGNIDPVSIESKISNRTKAILAVHWGGYPCDLDEIHTLARLYKLTVIEDAAHALGAIYKGASVGSISRFSCFSFQSIKHVTTGDGGAIACKNENDAKIAIKKRWFNIDRTSAKPSLLGERVYNVKELGFKYHLNDYEAALGLANISSFQNRLVRRRFLAKYYTEKLQNIPGLNLFQYKHDRGSAWWLFGMHVEHRDDFIRAMKSRKIEVSVVHQRIDRNHIFGGAKKDLIQQTRFDASQIHIPLHDNLTNENVDYIIQSIKKGW